MGVKPRLIGVYKLKVVEDNNKYMYKQEHGDYKLSRENGHWKVSTTKYLTSFGIAK